MNLLACALLLAAAPATDDARFEAFAQKYVQELLDRDPEAATRLGEHRNDARLNDYSAQGVERDLAAAKGGLAELARMDPKNLSPEDAVDYRILKNRLESQVYELQTLRGWQRNPLQYNIGGAIYALILNAIIDQKIHTAGMSEQEAIARMTKDGFQEEGEAVGKWKRAQLTSTQLSTYYVGNAEMNDIRAAWEKNHGKYPDLRVLHDAMLSFGNAAPKYVRERLGI